MLPLIAVLELVQSCNTPFQYLGQFYGVAGSAYTGSSIQFTTQQDSYNLPVIIVPILISGSSQSSYTNLYQIADSFTSPFNTSAVLN